MEYDAALVLWKRDNNGEIMAQSAISFGTSPLTEAHKKEYEENRSEMLPEVDRYGWERLANKDQVI